MKSILFQENSLKIVLLRVSCSIGLLSTIEKYTLEVPQLMSMLVSGIQFIVISFDSPGFKAWTATLFISTKLPFKITYAFRLKSPTTFPWFITVPSREYCLLICINSSGVIFSVFSTKVKSGYNCVASGNLKAIILPSVV